LFFVVRRGVRLPTPESIFFKDHGRINAISKNRHLRDGVDPILVNQSGTCGFPSGMTPRGVFRCSPKLAIKVIVIFFNMNSYQKNAI
jgi:hypothetical protein